MFLYLINLYSEIWTLISITLYISVRLVNWILTLLCLCPMLGFVFIELWVYPIHLRSRLVAVFDHRYHNIISWKNNFFISTAALFLRAPLEGTYNSQSFTNILCYNPIIIKGMTTNLKSGWSLNGTKFYASRIFKVAAMPLIIIRF